MSVNLVVASGVHQGKAIPVPGAQLVIGRDPGCHLRPASPAVSKRHCVVFLRDGKVYVKDFGSTNGTSVNGEPVTGEREVATGDRLQVGPLDFTLQITGSKADSTPVPESLQALPAQAALRSAIGAGAAPGVPAPPARVPGPSSAADDADRMAAMLLADDEATAGDIPDGSTAHELPAVDAAMLQAAVDAKAAAAKKAAAPMASSNAANDILRRYLRRDK